jgi:hypothetical protein
MKIGIVDLCTSHPENFVPILRDLGFEVRCVWDSGDTRPPGFADEFAKKFNIPKVCKALEEMVGEVDAVTVHGANWDTHIDRALPFIEAGKYVCIDKPIVGKVADVNRLIEIGIKHPGKIFGGSACQFAEEIVKMASDLAGAGKIISALAIGCNDLFSYGIHNVEVAQAVLGYDVQFVECLDDTRLGNYRVHFARGFDLHLHMHNPRHGWFVLVNTMEKGILSTGIDVGKLYRAFLGRFVDFIDGKVPGWSLADRLQPILVAIAMNRARTMIGRRVYLEDLHQDEGFDGYWFSDAYRNSRSRGSNIYSELTMPRWK